MAAPTGREASFIVHANGEQPIATSCPLESPQLDCGERCDRLSADTTENDATEFNESHLHENIFGYADLNFSERQAIMRVYKGQRLTADRIHSILEKAKLSGSDG